VREIRMVRAKHTNKCRLREKEMVKGENQSSPSPERERQSSGIEILQKMSSSPASYWRGVFIGISQEFD
jgi:hypothetical protein